MHFDQGPEATEAQGERRRMRYSPSCHGVAPVRGYRWQASRRSRASGGFCPAWDNANLAPAKSQARHGPARTLPQHCVHGRWRVVVVRRVFLHASGACICPGAHGSLGRSSIVYARSGARRSTSVPLDGSGNGGLGFDYSVKLAVTWYTRPPQPSSGNASDTLT
jgi:hypothetical protein